jgi:hypothetical protein
MESSTTHPELLFWLTKYLLAQDRSSFEQLPSFAPATAYLTFSSQMKAIALGRVSRRQSYRAHPADAAAIPDNKESLHQWSR